MAYKIIIQSNHFIILDTVSTVEEIREPRDQVKFKVDGTSYRFYPNYPSANRTGIDDGIGRTITEFPFADIVDSTGAAFASQDVLNAYLSKWIGFFLADSSESFGVDAGGRTRIAQITTLLDGKTLGADDTTLFENAGSGTAAYSNNKVGLSVTAGQYVIRQSKRYCPYFAGKSQLVEMTFDNFQGQTDVDKRVGYFSSVATAPYATTLDGFFLEDVSGDKKLKAYRSGTETISVSFEDMDNYSLVADYDWSKFTVIAFDFLWLGGAVLRLWLKTDLGFVLLHAVHYSGSATDTFTLSPNQPIRYEVRSTGGAGSLRAICCQVATEGSLNESGKTLAIFNTAAITANVIGTIYALKSLKKQTTYRDTAVQVLEIAVSNTATSDAGILMLIVNPTVSAAITYANNSKIQEGTPTTQTVTAGTGRVVCALPIGASGASNTMRENFLSFLSSSLNNTHDEYVLAYMPTTNNQTIHGVITIKEF